MSKVKESLNKFFSKFGFTVAKKITLSELDLDRIRLDDISNWLANCNDVKLQIEVINYLCNRKSYSQLQQDVVAKYVNSISVVQSKYFIEFGATDGISINNTFMLEQDDQWSGILVEPSRFWHDKLIKNRKCFIDFRCVWKESNILLRFQEMTKGEFSTIFDFVPGLNRQYSGNTMDTIEVMSISLFDLLEEYKAPKLIGFLSIDTEGSEYEILREFNFAEYKFNFIAVEHNYGPTRELIYHLLVSNGYIRVLTEMSKWDDWYVPAELSQYFPR